MESCVTYYIEFFYAECLIVCVLTLSLRSHVDPSVRVAAGFQRGARGQDRHVRATPPPGLLMPLNPPLQVRMLGAGLVQAVGDVCCGLAAWLMLF